MAVSLLSSISGQKRHVALLVALGAVALAAGSANGALVEVDDVVLRADGGFTPLVLPRHHFAPIDFQGHVDISGRGGGRPPKLQQALIDFDRDGRTTVPGTQTYAIVVPIEQRRGGFRYRARIDVPPIAAGFGAITHLDVAIGRRYRAAGKQRSYVSARCSDNILQTHGRFTFDDGTIIDGLVEKYCRSK